MTKAELIAQVAAQAQMSRAAAGKILTALIGGMADALQSQGKLTLPGFGVFVVVERSARTGRHPRSGAPLEIAASKTVKFKPGKELREAVK